MGAGKEKIITLKDVRPTPARGGARPTKVQLAYLQRGLRQPGGKLPLFDREGQRISDRTVRSCIEQGWAEPWFNNVMKPDWLVCKLTDNGRKIADDTSDGSVSVSDTSPTSGQDARA